MEDCDRIYQNGYEAGRKEAADEIERLQSAVALYVEGGQRAEAEIERLLAALTKIAKMEPSEIAPETFPGLVHGSALLFANSQRIARAALRAHEQSQAAELPQTGETK